MINQILCIVFMTLPSTFQGLAFEEMLEVDETKTKKWFRILCWTVLYGACVTFKVLLNDQSKAKTFKWIIVLVVQLAMLLYFYKDPIWRRIIALVAMIFGMCLSEVGLLFVIKIVEIESMMLWDFTQMEMVISTIAGTVFSIIGIILVAAVWKFSFHKGKIVRRLWYFVLYAIFSVTMLDSMKYAIVDGVFNYSVLYALILSLACNVILLIVIFNQSEQETMKAKYEENKRQAELEQMHYEEARQRQQTLAKVMAENNQVIEQVGKLLDDEQKDEAEQMLTELLHKIAQTKENQYCNIPIVNAILTEKQRECEEYRIHLETDIRIPEDIVIKQMDLCSIFSNLLDNAIRASKKVEEAVIIHLTVAAKGNYLIVKCDNPTMEEPAKTPEGSGYGQKILWDIAKRYQGDFRTKYEDKHYYTQLSVSVR